MTTETETDLPEEQVIVEMRTSQGLLPGSCPVELQLYRAEVYARKQHKEVCRRFMLLAEFIYVGNQNEKSRAAALKRLAGAFRLMIEATI